ncbi:MAG TPA: DUF4397 domain-containing protein, partial [Gemmatimonadales bacterium]|nr:DUF4397 domain-containing protein [Gemmatimonadales bacterium]
MKLFRFSNIALSALAFAAACNRDASFTEPIPPNAAIHWVEAVPDTMSEDMRVIDMVSNAGLYQASFRGSTIYYQGIQAGSRHIRIFNHSTDPVIAQQVLADTTIDLAATDSITFIHMGFARTGSVPARQVRLVPDKAPDPGAGNVGIRVIHAGAGLGNLDVFVIRRPQDTTALGAPFATNVAYAGVSAYTPQAADTGAQAMRVIVTATGTTTPILANVLLPAGVVADTVTHINPIAGAHIVGSVMTAVIVPRSVAGSQAPQAFTTPSAVV